MREGRNCAILRASRSPFGKLRASLGSNSLTTSITGTEVARTSYYPYGGTRTTSGAQQTDRLFTDQRSESAALGALYDYGARHYDVLLGRFLSADSVVPGAGNPQALNRYGYTFNNPLRYVDPSGHGAVGPKHYCEPICFPNGWGGSKSPYGPDYDPEPRCVNKCDELAIVLASAALGAFGSHGGRMSGGPEDGPAPRSAQAGTARQVGDPNPSGLAQPEIAANDTFAPRGGMKNDIIPREGYDFHHTPAKSVSPLGDEGPGIQMRSTDHVRTGSYGGSSGARTYRAKQAELIRNNRFDDAVQMDINDVTSLFPGKYDSAILEMIEILP